MESATKAESVVRLESLDLRGLAARARDWAYLNGLVMHCFLLIGECNNGKTTVKVMRSQHSPSVIHAPIAVLPCPFPRSGFQRVR